MDLTSIATVATALGGITFVGAAWKGLRRFFRFQDRLEQTLAPDADGKTISERVSMMTVQVENIQKQVLPNSGGSLRDAVDQAAALAKTASDNAATASVAAQSAVDKAERAEIIGNFERRDIRKKLDEIDSKIVTSTDTLTSHLVEAAAQGAQITQRLDVLEQNVDQRSA